MSKFDLLILRTAKVMGLVLGSFIMVYETLADHTDRPYLYAAALLMMGLQIAEIVEKLATLTAGLGATKTGASLAQPQTQPVIKSVETHPSPPTGPEPPSKP